MAYMNVHGERVLITDETIVNTWKYFAGNQQGCVDEVLNGDVSVNDIESYIESCEQRKQEYLRSMYKVKVPSGCALWFWQRAYYIQNGESVGILA